MTDRQTGITHGQTEEHTINSDSTALRAITVITVLKIGKNRQTKKHKIFLACAHHTLWYLWYFAGCI